MSLAEILARPPRVTLRPLELGDATALHEGFSDPETMRFWSTPPHTTFEQTERWVRVSVEAMEVGTAINIAALHEDKLIGRVGFWRDNELGFLFLRSSWGKGLAREAVARVIDLAFSSRDWPDVKADVDPVNERSLRLLTALGFEKTGYEERTFCVAGVWSDSVYLALKRPAADALPVTSSLSRSRASAGRGEGGATS